MSQQPPQTEGLARACFGPFAFDLQAGELYRGSRRLRVQAQPIRLLGLLVRHRERVVTREQIREALWGERTHVDFDQGINHCVRQLRSTLGDAADTPRYIETIPRQGYRFIGEVRPGEPPANGSRSPSPTSGRRLRIALSVAFAAVTLLAALAALHRAQRDPHSPVLAVLPFQNFDADDSWDYFGDALTEELITQLGKRYSGRLGVIARTSAMRYKETELGIEEITRELGVDYVLEGSVRRAGERLRITAQLIRASDASHLWAANFDRTVADVIDVQEEVSLRIAEALGLELLPPGARDVGASTSPEVYELYLQGANAIHDFDEEEPRRAVRLLESALELDSGFAPAWAALARAHLQLPVAPHEWAPRARAAAKKALALDETLHDAHLTLARIRFYHDWDLEGARRSFQRAVDLHPGFTSAWHAYAAYFSVQGEHDRALDAVGRARALDPLSPGVTSDVGWYSYFARRHDEAIDRCRETLVRQPEYYWGHRCIIFAALQLGEHETARAQMLEEMAQRGASPEQLEQVEAVDLDSALAAYWDWDLERTRRFGERYYVSPAAYAMTYLARGETELALTQLEQAVSERAGWILPFLRVDPMADPVRDDPRFVELMHRIEHSPVFRAAR